MTLSGHCKLLLGFATSVEKQVDESSNGLLWEIHSLPT